MADAEKTFEALLSEAPLYQKSETVSLTGALARSPEEGKFALMQADGSAITLDSAAVKSHTVIGSSFGQQIVQVEVDAEKVPKEITEAQYRPGPQQPGPNHHWTFPGGWDAGSPPIYQQIVTSPLHDGLTFGLQDQPITSPSLDHPVTHPLIADVHTGIADVSTGLADHQTSPIQDTFNTGIADTVTGPLGDIGGVNDPGYPQPFSLATGHQALQKRWRRWKQWPLPAPTRDGSPIRTRTRRRARTAPIQSASRTAERSITTICESPFAADFRKRKSAADNADAAPDAGRERRKLVVKIMIVSGMQDVHAQAVMSALAERGDAEAELLDLSEFPMKLSLSMAFEDGCRRFALRRHGENGGTFDLSEIGAVWWRRPQPYSLPDAMTDTAQQRFALSEAETAFHGLYQSLDAFWVNPPLRDIAASRKPWQLFLAQEIGLDTPPTLMTSDPDDARAFWKRHEGAVIHKQFIAMPDAWRETRRLKAEDVPFAEAVRLAPVIFQRYVEAVAEIRAIVIGREIFAASTDLTRTEYPEDVRMNMNAPYQPHTLPEEVQTLLLALMARMGLEYGAIDLRLTAEGRYVFLEINPAGQFLYIERETGQKIAAALAAHLVGNAITK